MAHVLYPETVQWPHRSDTMVGIGTSMESMATGDGVGGVGGPVDAW